MRHSVILMFGRKSGDNLLSLYQKILRSGNPRTENFLRAFTVESEEDKLVLKTISKLESDDLKDSSAQYIVSEYEQWEKKDRKEKIQSFLRKIHREQVNIRERGEYTTLHTSIILPLYDDLAAVMEFLNVAKDDNQVDVDILAIAEDLRHSFVPAQSDNDDLLHTSTKKNLEQLVAFRRKHSNAIGHLVAIQDYQNGGVSLSLDNDALLRIIAEYQALMMEAYRGLFGSQVNNSDLQTFGLSMLNLDDVYFKEYLYRKALSKVILSQMVSKIDTGEEAQIFVDINKVSKIANDIVQPWQHTLSEIYKREIQQQLDLGVNEDTIIIGIDDILKKEFGTLKEKLEQYIHDEKLTLPEKRCVLAAILGQDDALYINDLNNEESLNFYDLERESMNHFLEMNNYILQHEEYKDQAILSENDEDAVYPLDELKQNRIVMRRSISYIRNLEKEQSKLEQQMQLQENASQCFIKNGVFTFGEHEFKLLPHIEEIPLREKYVPHLVQKKSLDMASMMPSIKDQGQQGTCLAFAITSVFETLYKRKTSNVLDFSEQFLYYIARDKAGTTNEDNGSCVSYALEALAEIGICEEHFWKYMQPATAYNIKPSQEAYNDAANRKVAKALQVDLTEDAIRSALADGYPVIISANLYDNFGRTPGGFVTIPTSEERKTVCMDGEVDHRRHAMVICGFNDETKIFKVRNSWGADFGDRGYCYMPYAYITDPELTNYAAVITEIAVAETVTINTPLSQEYPQLSFNKQDTSAQYGINKILLSEEYVKLETLKAKDDILSKRCLALKQLLKNYNTQNALEKSADLCYTEDLQKVDKQLSDLIEQYTADKRLWEERRNWKYIKWGLVALGVIAVFVILYFIFHGNWIQSKPNLENWRKEYLAPIYRWAMLGTAIVWGVWVLVEYILHKKKLKVLREEFEQNESYYVSRKTLLKKKLSELNIKTYLAGKMLTTFFDLGEHMENKYGILVSLVDNLKQLKIENDAQLSTMNVSNHSPFYVLLSNDMLNGYFDKQSTTIIGDITIDKFIAGYDVTSEAFDNFLSALKNNIDARLDKELSMFSIYQYMSEKSKYPYVQVATCKQQLKELDENSEVFLLCNDVEALNPSKILFTHVDNDDVVHWQSTYRQAFSVQPSSAQISSKSKLVLVRLLDLNLNQIEWMN